MTDKDIIEGWLKGRLADLYEESQCEVPELPKEVIEGKMLALRETLSFIDSLEVKEVDLDEAAKHNTFKYVFDKNVKETLISELKYIGDNSFKDGAKWQEKKDQSTIELAEDHAMLAGMEKMKEQMMKNATEVTVHIDAGGYPYTPEIELYDYDKDIPLAKEGDKYKVVLIKED